MQLAQALLGAVLLVGCMQIGTGAGTGAGTGTGTGTGRGDGGGEAGGGGTDCVLDPQTQVTLCAKIDACPGVDVAQEALPNCGFRLGASSSLDLECLCAGALCPIGVPNTCDEAAQLLSTQNALAVCQQVSEGRCLGVAQPEAGVNPLCKACENQCSGDPSCMQVCGC